MSGDVKYASGLWMCLRGGRHPFSPASGKRKGGKMGHQIRSNLMMRALHARELRTKLVKKFPFSWVSKILTITALWARSTKKTDWSTGPLARPFARSLAPLTCSLALHYLLRWRAPLRSLSLARSLRSLPSSWDSDLIDGYLFCVFSFLARSLLGRSKWKSSKNAPKISI